MIRIYVGSRADIEDMENFGERMFGEFYGRHSKGYRLKDGNEIQIIGKIDRSKVDYILESDTIVEAIKRLGEVDIET